jgi:hypothetical protein
MVEQLGAHGKAPVSRSDLNMSKKSSFRGLCGASFILMVGYEQRLAAVNSMLTTRESTLTIGSQPPFSTG